MDEVIHGFRKLYSCHLDDYKAEGVLYRHVRTGMEVFSVTADDSEYFFSYAFRTLPEDSTGVFHILEHTVLSGSRKYPGRDPFSALDSHSCNSYMNALTCPDRTLYPAASPVKKDFDNIFSLYTDHAAVRKRCLFCLKACAFHRQSVFLLIRRRREADDQPQLGILS